MSVGIAIQFLAGKLHATPWDHQVNEGVVEFPPSPWRVLRALVSAYYRLPDPPPRPAAAQLLTTLAGSLPHYVLPPWSTAHTRHYMPIRKEGKNTTTRVFDTFLVLGNGALDPNAQVVMIWQDVLLSESEKKLLQHLCRQVSYLGRAESWAELKVTEEQPTTYQAVPLQPGQTAAAERVKVLAPLDVAGLEGFRAALDMLPKPKKGKAKFKAPADVMEALELDIGELHSQNWNGIPGSRWVAYEVKEPTQSRKQNNVASIQRPTLARYAVVSNVLPNLTAAVSIGDRLHRALIKRSEQESGKPAPVFSGRKENGEHRTDDHRHAWYLPEDTDGDGKIDHLVVYASEGFDQAAISALCSLRRLWGSESFDLQLVMVAIGQAEQYVAEVNGDLGKPLVIGRGRVWRSLTPVVLPRHPKFDRRGNPKIDPLNNLQIDGPEHQVRRLLRQLGLDEPVEVKECLSGKQIGHYDWRRFQRHRYGGEGSKGPSSGYGFELRFEKPQRGPIALGYGAHFGLGVFVPVE